MLVLAYTRPMSSDTGWVEVGAWAVNVDRTKAVARKLRGHKAGQVCTAPARVDYKGFIRHGRWDHPVTEAVDQEARKLLRQRFGKVEETSYDRSHKPRRAARRRAFY